MPLDTHKHPKLESYALIDAAKKKAQALFQGGEIDRTKMTKRIFESLKEQIFRSISLRNASGRTNALSIRFGQSGLKPAYYLELHGSAVFTRGETCKLVTATLGTSGRRRPADGLAGRRISSAIPDAL